MKLSEKIQELLPFVERLETEHNDIYKYNQQLVLDKKNLMTQRSCLEREINRLKMEVGVYVALFWIAVVLLAFVIAVL